MDEECLMPSQADIELALKIEKSVKSDERALYLECMNNKPMSERVTPRELHDGCILTYSVFIVCSNNGEMI